MNLTVGVDEYTHIVYAGVKFITCRKDGFVKVDGVERVRELVQSEQAYVVSTGPMEFRGIYCSKHILPHIVSWRHTLDICRMVDRLMVGGYDKVSVVKKLNKAPFTKVLLNQHPAVALIDTGACVTLISSEHAKRIKLPIQPCTLGLDLETAGDSKLVLEGQADVIITIGSSDFHIRVYIGRDASDDVIIGQDIMVDYNFVVDFRTKTLRLGDMNTVPFYTGLDEDQKRGLIEPVVVTRFKTKPTDEYPYVLRRAMFFIVQIKVLSPESKTIYTITRCHYKNFIIALRRSVERVVSNYTDPVYSYCCVMAKLGAQAYIG